MDPNKQDECAGISSWNELLAQICHWWRSERKGATRLLSFLLDKGILKLYLKAGADPSALIVGPSPRSNTCRSRTAATVYLELCFNVLDQAPAIQALYLDVLSEFLQLSSEKVLKDVTDEFCTILSDEDKEALHWNLPFFAKVNNMLRLSLGARESGTAESLQSLDETGKQFFPSDLYTPMNVATESRKRKPESSSGRRWKNKRETN